MGLCYIVHVFFVFSFFFFLFLFTRTLPLTILAVNSGRALAFSWQRLWPVSVGQRSASNFVLFDPAPIQRKEQSGTNDEKSEGTQKRRTGR